MRRLLVVLGCCLAVLIAGGFWVTHRTGTRYGELDAEVSLGPSCRLTHPPRACLALRGHRLHVALFGVRNNTFYRVYATDPAGHLHVRVPQGTYWMAFEYGHTGMPTNRAQTPFTVTGRGIDIGRVWPRVFRPYKVSE